jgi:hypothetical protein
VGGQNGIITGSVSYTSSFYGGLVFSGPTASVIFPTSSANFGTGSFTVELAFRPARIEGIHYLVSKNSGSFPNCGIYLSGSGGSGKLFSEFRISSTVSCSVSSSSTFVTGSNYFADIIYAPIVSSSVITVFGNPENTGTGNGSGTLTSTGSLIVGNINRSSSQAFSGSLLSAKIYNTPNYQALTNYLAVAPRMGNQVPPSPALEVLVVGAGGAAGYGTNAGQGGGGGGTLYSRVNLLPGVYSVTVGAGGTGGNPNGAPGGNSSFPGFIATGGRGGGPVGDFPTRAGNSGLTIITNTSYIGGLSYTLFIGPNQWAGGGGGGAGQDGQDAISPTNTLSGPGNKAGDGGSGVYIAAFAAIGGSPAGWFGGGGGGGYHIQAGIITSSIASLGGGGGYRQTGSVNTGGGGGGGNYTETGAAGGSGIVAVRYVGPPTATGGEITQSAGYTYHVFRQTGSSTFTVF